MKLWYGARTRAFTALWMVEETGLPYTLERVNIRDPSHPSAALLAVNPMGKVPALEDGAAKFGDNGAICAYLADKVPEKSSRRRSAMQRAGATISGCCSRRA